MSAGLLDRLVALKASPGFREVGEQGLRVLIVLLTYASRDGIAWPAVSTIQEETGIDRRDVQRALRKLEAAGLVTTVTPSTGRRSCRYLVLPDAVEGGFRGAGDSTASASVAAGESTAGESPAVRSGGAGDFPRRGGGIPTVGAGESPARTYQEPVQPPAELRSADEGDPADGDGGPIALRFRILRRLEALRLPRPGRNPFLAAKAIDQAIRDGLTEPQLEQLAELAQRGKQPNGLLWHWLDDPHQWLAVLADAESSRKERKLRRAPSARGDGAAVPEPMPVAELVRRAAGGAGNG